MATPDYVRSLSFLAALYNKAMAFKLFSVRKDVQLEQCEKTTSSPIAAEKILRKIQEKTSCGICLEPYKRPKLLTCYHAFCERCLKTLVRGRYSISCPNCRRDTALPMGGVSELQAAFHLDTLLEIQEIVKNMTSGDLCPKHPEKEADFYCEECEEIICSYCVVDAHRDHQYDLLSSSFSKHDKVIDAAILPIKTQINEFTTAIKSLEAKCAKIVHQKRSIVADINTIMTCLRQVIDARGKKLIEEAENETEKKLKALNAQRDEFQLKLGQLKQIFDVVESRHTCSNGKILEMKTRVLQQIESIAGRFKPEALVLAKQADMKFHHVLPDLVSQCRGFGKVYCHSLYPEKCQASGEGIKVATCGETACVSVETIDGEGKPYLTALNNLRYELVASDGSVHIRGTGERRPTNMNVYDISYVPEEIGVYKLHIKANSCPIFNSPFTVTVLPLLTTPASIIEDIQEPIGIAVREGGEVVVVEYGRHCVSFTDCSQRKKSFGSHGSALGEFDRPEGVAIDGTGNILVADLSNHRVQQFSSAGDYLRSSGRYGSRSLQFKFPRDVTVHPHTQNIYVADWGNHRIQILNSDLTYFDNFGRSGSGKGEFNGPCDISTDREGNVYVADCDNHRIQVFTVDGVYLRQFGKEGKQDGELKCPVSIAIDSNSGVVYIGERGSNRVSVFYTNGEFIKSFGQEEFSSPFGLAIDTKGNLYVCDTDNDCIQIFEGSSVNFV